MKSFAMIAIVLALGVPSLALAQPAGRSGATAIQRIDRGPTITPVRDAVRVRPDVARVERRDVRRRAHEPNRRRFHEPNRRRFHQHMRRRYNAANG